MAKGRIRVWATCRLIHGRKTTTNSKRNNYTNSRILPFDWYTNGEHLNKTSNGKQRYKCRSCKRSLREAPGTNAYEEATKEQVLRAYHERTSLRRSDTHLWGIAPNRYRLAQKS